MADALSRALLVLSLSVSLHAAAAEVTVQVTREGEVLRIEATADIEGTIAQTWQVLTDYNRLHEFIPNLTVSRVIERGRDGITIEQKGEARLLIFSYPIEVRLVVNEFPPGRVVSKAIAGNFKQMSGVYTLEAQEGRVRLRYSGRMEPDFFVPPLIGTWVLRYHVHETFAAMVDEIVRRQRVAPAGESGKQ
jgi:ribosome-associated toxin RatA of RatAB toxin-antitoxin module